MDSKLYEGPSSIRHFIIGQISFLEGMEYIGILTSP